MRLRNRIVTDINGARWRIARIHPEAHGWIALILAPMEGPYAGSPTTAISVLPHIAERWVDGTVQVATDGRLLVRILSGGAV